MGINIIFSIWTIPMSAITIIQILGSHLHRPNISLTYFDYNSYEIQKSS